MIADFFLTLAIAVPLAYIICHVNNDSVCLICRSKFKNKEDMVWIGYDIDSLSIICRDCYEKSQQEI